LFRLAIRAARLGAVTIMMVPIALAAATCAFVASMQAPGIEWGVDPMAMEHRWAKVVAATCTVGVLASGIGVRVSILLRSMAQTYAARVQHMCWRCGYWCLAARCSECGASVGEV
jgi:hypothetical protein